MKKNSFIILNNIIYNLSRTIRIIVENIIFNLYYCFRILFFYFFKFLGEKNRSNIFIENDYCNYRYNFNKYYI